MSGGRKSDIKIECEHSEVVDPLTLVDHPRNPHKHPKNQIKALALNIQQFGWRHPIVVSKLTGHIVAGHGRKLAAIELGCKAPVDLQHFASENDELAVLIADNMIPELAEMDAQLLAANRELLEVAGFDLVILGVSDSSDMMEHSDIPDIQIDEKILLEKITVFAETSIKSEVVKIIREVLVKFGEACRIVT